jgi:hypothetical protein
MLVSRSVAVAWEKQYVNIILPAYLIWRRNGEFSGEWRLYVAYEEYNITMAIGSSSAGVMYIQQYCNGETEITALTACFILFITMQ